MFLVVYEFSGSTTEVVVYRENSESQTANSKSTTVKGEVYKECVFVVYFLKNQTTNASNDLRSHECLNL